MCLPFLRCHPVEGLVVFLHDCLLLISVSTQNTQVSEAKEFRKSYSLKDSSIDGFKSVTNSIWCYQGAVVMPKWKDVDTHKSMILKL